MEIKGSISISQTPEKIWNYLLLVTTDVEWRTDYSKTEWTSKPPYGIGSTGIHYHKKMGAIPWTIIKWEEGCHMEWIIGESKFRNSIGSYHVEPENGGSLVTVHSKMILPFIMRIIMAVIGRMVVKADLIRLKTIMEKKG
ncbi:SRPBCC family protein [Bacteroidota bacterium]